MKIVAVETSVNPEIIKSYFKNVDLEESTFDKYTQNDQQYDIGFYHASVEKKLKDFYISFRNENQSSPLFINANFSSRILDTISNDRNVYIYKNDSELIKILENYEGAKFSSLDIVPIPLRSFLILPTTPVDLFLRINESKILKIARANCNHLIEILEKYEQKSCEYVFVKESDFSKLLSYISQRHENALWKNLSPENKKMFSSEVFDFVHYSLHMVGLNKETFNITNQLLMNTAHVVKSSNNSDLKALWKSYCKNKNYLIEHSLLLSHIICGAAKYFDCKTRNIEEKLLMAAMFHDIAITDETMAKEYGTKIQKEKYSKYSTEEFESHHEKAIVLLRSMKGVPSDVEVVIGQHHEKPDGTGFPRGLAGKNINALSALFIVTHDFVQQLYIEGFSIMTRNYILRDLASKYTDGYFLQALNSLNELFEIDFDKKSGSAA